MDRSDRSRDMYEEGGGSGSSWNGSPPSRFRARQNRGTFDTPGDRVEAEPLFLSLSAGRKNTGFSSVGETDAGDAQGQAFGGGGSGRLHRTRRDGAS